MNSTKENVQYATFVSNVFEAFAACLALKSLHLNVQPALPPMVFVPEEVLIALESDFPKFNFKKFTNKCNAHLKTGYKNGFNPRNSFRVALKNIARKSNNVPVLYFAPTMYFNNDVVDLFAGNKVAVAQAPDDLWPIMELYGPSLNEIWQSIANFAGVEFDKTVNKEYSVNYWRRYAYASHQLFYFPSPIENAQTFEDVSRKIIEAELPELSGQERDLNEAALAAMTLQEGGKFVDGWVGS